MDQQRVATIKDVTSTFAAWKTVNDRIKALQQELKAHDASHEASRASLEAELKQLETEAERLLAHASDTLLKVKTPRSSSGDSTWG